MADPTSAQDFNRYVYGRNNPLSYTDPTGERVIPGEAAIPQGAFDTWDSGIRMPQRNFWNYVNHSGEAVSNGYQGSQINFVNLCWEESRQIGFNGEITFRYQYSYVDYSTSGVVSTANGYKSVSLPTIGVAAGKYTINLNDYGNNGGKGAQGQGGGSSIGNGLDWDDWAIGLPGTLVTTAGNIKQNKWWWLSAKGSLKSTKLLKVGLNGKFIIGVQGLRNGYKIAGEVANLSKVAGNVLGGIGVAVSLYDMTQNGINVSNSLDSVMGATTFIPAVGWIISGTYFTASFATEVITGKSIGDHAQDMVNEW